MYYRQLFGDEPVQTIVDSRLGLFDRSKIGTNASVKTFSVLVSPKSSPKAWKDLLPELISLLEGERGLDFKEAFYGIFINNDTHMANAIRYTIVLDGRQEYDDVDSYSLFKNVFKISQSATIEGTCKSIIKH